MDDLARFCCQNPDCNLYARRSGLPMTPFRTDDWPGLTAGKN